MGYDRERRLGLDKLNPEELEAWHRCNAVEAPKKLAEMQRRSAEFMKARAAASASGKPAAQETPLAVMEALLKLAVAAGNRLDCDEPPLRMPGSEQT